MEGNKSSRSSNNITIIKDDLEYCKKRLVPESCQNNFKCTNYCKFKVSVDSITYHDRKFVHLSCMKCNNDWYICRDCTFQRTPLSNIKNVKRHNFAFHVKKNKELKSNDNMSKTVIDITSERAENSHYFSRHHDLNGPAYLVGRSQYQLSSICSYLSQEDVLLQMKFANFFLRFSSK